MTSAVGQLLRRIRTLPGIATTAAGAATILLLAAYLQARADQDCVTNAVCIEVGTRPDGSPVCKDIQCGVDLWIFWVPAGILGGVALIAGVLWIRRARPPNGQIANPG